MDIGQVKQQARQYLQRGDTAAARDLLLAVCERFTGDAEALALLGVALTMTGRHEEAVSRFKAALALQPAVSSLHNNLGNVLKVLGRLTEAEASYRTALKIRPDDVHACSNLGALLAETGRPEEAETILRKATTLAPGFADAWNHLGNLAAANGDFTNAETCYRRALEANPHFVDSRCNLADMLLLDRRMDEAEAIYREALTVQHGNTNLRAGLARLLERKGEFAEAQELLSALEGDDPRNPRVLLVRAALADRTGDTEDVIHALEAAIDQPLADRQRMDLHFELGRLYDRAGIFARAFEHYRAGNQLDSGRFDEAATAAEFARIKAAFAGDAFARRADAGSDSDVPVFIVGMPRSGTSLVEQIIASHPAVYGAGELDALDELTAALPARCDARRTYPECLADLVDAAVLRAVAEEHIERLRALAPGALRVSDKMPHNFRHLGLIAMLFPKARIIHCRRDPRDTCLSVYFTQFNVNHPYANDLAHLASYHAHYRDLMEYWEAVLPVPMLAVDYEKLVADQEATVRSIIDFLDLPWDDTCLQFHSSRRVVDTPSYQQVRKPIYDRSVGRWKNYRDFIAPFFDANVADSSQRDRQSIPK